ncbi:MAG: radical SAM protein, partial [Bdellovibrionota bacterium]
MRVLLLTPPMTQLNTPYPATAYLTGFLRKHGVDAVQADPAIELVVRLFSRTGLERIAECAAKLPAKSRAKSVRSFLAQLERYSATVDAAIRFLQGRDPSLALRIASGEFLPEGPRFAALRDPAAAASGEGDPLAWAFGALGVQDRAKYLASLYVDDLADMIREGIDEKFALSRYGEKLAASAPSFDPLLAALNGPRTLVDETLEEITRELLQKHQPTLVALTAPFPGNVYGALRIARTIRKHAPQTKIALGGGYANTELRELKDPRIFDELDFITLDDGERPMLALLEHLN